MHKRKFERYNFRRRALFVLVSFFIASVVLTRAQQFQQPYPGAPAPDDAQLNTLNTLDQYLRKSPTAHQTAAGPLTIKDNSPDASAYVGATTQPAGVLGAAGTENIGLNPGVPVAIYGYSSEGPLSYGVYGYAQGPGSTGVIGKTESGLAGKFWGTVGVQEGVGGQYDGAFDTDGVLTEATIKQYTTATRDAQYMYLGGTESDGDWRIEKKSLITGGSVWSVESDVAGTDTALKDIAIDGAYMYLAGQDRSGGQNQWRLEKRRLDTGALCTFANCGATQAFDSAQQDGIITVATAGSDLGANAIAIDDTYLYVGGYDNVSGGGGFRLEKRRLTNGNLCSAAEGCHGLAFDNDANGDALGGDDDGIIKTHGGAGHTLTDLVIDNDFIYLVGARPIDTKNWYLEKRHQTTGYPCNNNVVWGCGLDYFGDASTGSVFLGGNKVPQSIIFETTSLQLFIAGFDSDEPQGGKWRIEKRETNGNLCTLANSAACGKNGTAFSSDGIITVGGRTPAVTIALAADDQHFYLAVQSGSSAHGWRAEKRDAYSSNLNNDWGYQGEQYSGSPTLIPFAMLTTPTNLIVAGTQTSGATTIGRIESRFIEKAGTASVEEPLTATAIKATSNRYITPGVAALNGIKIEGDNMRDAFYSLHGYNNILGTFGVYGYSGSSTGLVASSTAYSAEARGMSAYAADIHTPGGVYAASPAWNAVETLTANLNLYQLIARTSAKTAAGATASEIADASFTGVYASGGAYAGYFDGLVEITNGFLALNNTQLTEARLIDLLAWCGSLCQ